MIYLHMQNIRLMEIEVGTDKDVKNVLKIFNND